MHVGKTTGLHLVRMVTLVGVMAIPVQAGAQGGERFQSDEPSYLLLNRSARDQTAIRAHLSMRYVMLPHHAGWEIFGSYSGEFDFYALTRDSSPVVGRMHNPAIRARWHNAPGWDWVDVAVEHRSNGQVKEFTTAASRAEAQQAYAQNNYAYFDGVSHSTNYLSLAGQTNLVNRSFLGGLSLNTKLKLYVNQDTEIHWGPLNQSGTRVSDYDRVTWRVMSDKGYAIDLVVGDKGLSRASVNVDWNLASQTHFPLYVRAHWGPMNTLSDYTRSQSSIGIGLRFCDWRGQGEQVCAGQRSN